MLACAGVFNPCVHSGCVPVYTHILISTHTSCANTKSSVSCVHTGTHRPMCAHHTCVCPHMCTHGHGHCSECIAQPHLSYRCAHTCTSM